jgi:signal transduction histidine kinase
MLNAFKLDISVNIITIIILLICGISIVTINYYRKNKFYKLYITNLDKLSKKYLILETIPEPVTYEEKLMVNSLYEINKSMLENLNEYQRSVIEFKEFVEIWIHEVKIPISSMVLKCHNNKEKYDKSFLSLIRRLDNNIDEILYYVRSENTEKDFAINEVDLKEVIRNVGIKNKDDLLENNINFESKVGKTIIHTDKKWLEFIINQIINNSIKYKKDKDSLISINAKEEKDKTI